jgi:hypothetical protein
MHDVDPYAGMMMVSALQAAVVLKQATAIPLPTNKDWRQAKNDDHDLSRLV